MTCIGLVLLILGASPYPVWQNVYDWGNTDRAYGSVLTSVDSFIVSGESNPQGDFDCVLLNLSRQGDTLWTIFYDDNRYESGRDVDVDSAGNIYVACACDWDDWPLGCSADILKYSPSGELIWARSGYTNLSERVIVGQENKIFLAMRYQNPVGVGARIAGYNNLGALLWTSYHLLNGDIRPTGLALSSDGTLWISCLFPCNWCGWEPDGTPKGFHITYEENVAKGQAIGIDQGDNVFIAGDLYMDSRRNLMLLKYLINGYQLWPEAKVYDLGHNEYCTDITLDSISDCYLAGWQDRGGEEDVALVKTDSAGNMLWAWVDTLEGKQEIEAIEVDADGYIYLAGSHHNGEDWDMLVMKVAQPLTITGRVTDSTGKAMEGIPVALTGDTLVEVITDTGGYYSIEVYNGGEYTVSPNLPGWSFTPSSYQYAPLAHREFDQDFEGRWTAVAEKPVTHSIRLEANASRICFSLPRSSHIRLAFYDACGREVAVIADESYAAGSHQINLPEFEAGIYFVRLQAGASTVSRKLVVLE